MADAARIALPVVLIGPMGAGKSRVGAQLAAALGAPFVDTDQRIVARYGPIDEIFAREGEEYFRIIEREIVAEALREPAVVALGGGAVLHPETRADLESLAVVLLRVDAEAVEPRLAGGTRPLIAEGGIERWKRILAERTPVYESLADLDLDTSRRPVASIVADLTGRLGELP
ncbi:shikimate kinase [Agromyces aerolatus]|uniref:shikimate kinase n=1 Tax=Agromyces sp. LY-1074 TaxID=3074080 RepID=UPI00285A4504|nr:MULTISPECIES: shikimate kinase [unclassified Agromyces]MDR5700620.1 shikimate kinase [Agromyces sp. LY-1074]MDR5707141.1 shikimate kinase [Agromyces sp. LY-1358]